MRPAERAVLVGCVLAVAAVLRVAFVGSAHVVTPLAGDAGQYAQYARNLCEHGVFSLATDAPPAPDSFRSPGYPGYLAICRLLGGGAHWQAVACWGQVVLGVLTVLALYRTVRTFAGFPAALGAAVLAALSPHLVVSCGYLLTECLAAALLTIGCWFLDGAGRVRVAVAAAAFGLAVLTNEALLPVPLVVGGIWWWRGGRRGLWFLGLALVPFLAWQVRNQVRDPALRGSARVVASVSHGSYPGMVYGDDPASYGFPYRVDPEQPQFGSSWSEVGRVLGPRVAAAPWRYLRWYLLEKPVWLWQWDLVQGDGVLVYAVRNSPYERHAMMALSQTVMRWLHVPLMLLAAGGAVWALARLRSAPGWTLAAAAASVVVVTLAYVPVIPDPRYLQPVRPLVFGLAAVAAAGLWRACWRGRRTAPAR